jgi:hypothetical protein
LAGLANKKTGMLRHTKLAYDPHLNYPYMCKKLYGDNKYLCVAEKMSVNAHVHFQGVTNLTTREYDDLFTELTCEHYLKRDNKKARPVRHVRAGDVDELGFQYMCKENPPNILARNQFEDEDIQALHEASEEHVQELKCGLKRKLHELDPEPTPQDLHRKYRMEGLAYYEASDKMPPPNFQKLVLWAMYTSPGASRATKEYVSERI